MRMFDYCCTCGFIFTFLQPTSEKKHNAKKCPKCGGIKPTRMFPRINIKSFYGPRHPRHRRGMSRAMPQKNYPLYSKEDLK